MVAPELRAQGLDAPSYKRFVQLVGKYITPYWKSIILLMAGSYVAAILLAIFPFILAAILDLALNKPMGGEGTIGVGDLSLSNLGAALFQWFGIDAVGNTRQAIAILAGVFLGLGVLQALVTFLNYMVALRIRAMAARDLQFDLYRHILGLSMGFFNRTRTGELVSRLDRDTINVTSSLEHILTKFMVTPLLVGFYGFLLLRTTPSLLIAVAAAAVLHLALTRGIQNPIRRRVADQFTAMANVSANMYESILSIRVVKSLTAENYELRRLREEIRKVVRANIRYGIFKHVEEPSRLIINYVLEAGIILFAAITLFSGDMDAASFILFIYIGRALLRPLGELATALTGVQAALGASARVFQLLDERPDLVDGPDSIDEFKNKIHLNAVSFSYGKVAALEEIDLEINKGELVALVGPSGAGKSTLTDLVLRFYDPQKGSITIDGRDLRTLGQRTYRSLFGVVPQEPLLFNATVRDNIAYGREDIPDDRILWAADVANAHDFISKMPDGYQTSLGDRGIRLSGGERQRIAIARAIIRRPPIMIFDEATSSLDSESERLVQDAIDKVILSGTAIVIAHRLSTVLKADKIVVLEAGRIVGQGTHEQLMGSNQLYKRLYDLQFAGELPGELVTDSA